MNYSYILCFFSFILLNCKNTYAFILFLFLFIVYQFKYRRFSYFQIIFVILLLIHSNINYSILNNCVLETHEKYVIASVNHEKVLIYTDDLYFFGEMVHPTGEMSDISSLSNFYTFDFKEYMEQKNITKYYDSKDITIQKKDSLQRRMFEYIKSLNENLSNILLKLFYGYDTNQNLIYTSGLHYSYLNQSLYQFASKCLNSIYSNLFSSLFVFAFGILFPFHFSLLRILASNFIRIVFSNSSTKDKVGIQYLLCMFIYPSCVFSLSFLIPFILHSIQSFGIDTTRRKLSSYMSLVFLQFYKLNQCDLISVIFFNFLRKLNSLGFILGLFQMSFNQFDFISYFEMICHRFYELNDRFIIYGHVSMLILFMFIFLLITYMHQKKTLLYCILLLVCIPLQAFICPFYTITFLNVGQGDSILIQAPFHNHNILVDIPLNQDQEVIDVLHAVGIHKIHSLIFTHGDSDHNGGKEAFLEKFKVDEIIETKKDIRFINQTLFSVNDKIYDNKNDNSLVYFGKVGSLNICLMGDASKQVERDIINKYSYSCDILKVGHHGSSTSTDQLFIQSIQPHLAVISVKKENRYGHPHEEVIQTLKKYNVNTYMTSKDGAIMIKSFLNFNFIATSQGEFGIIIT